MAQNKSGKGATGIGNLRTPTTELAREIGAKGGRAAAKTKQRRKTLKEAYLSIADKPYKPIGELAKMIVAKHGTVTVDEAIMLAQVAKAANGDTAAATYVRDTIGERPTDKQEVAVTMSGADRTLLAKVAARLDKNTAEK